MRPRSLTGRILVAFAAVSVALWLTIGGTLFVVLRGLHAEATTGALADTAQTLIVRFRGGIANREIRAIVAEIHDAVAQSGTTVHVIARNGSFVDVSGVDPEPVGAIAIPADLHRGEVVESRIDFDDGQPHLYAAVVLSEPGGTGPRAVLLSRVDRSGADALRDVLRTLPIVILVSLLVGVPLAIGLSRSVSGPLRRLAAATATFPGLASPPLPLDGPTEVRDLTERFNAMSAEVGATRTRESELLANLRHDLRTPLTVISGFATALADGTATGADAGPAAKAIEEEAARLERLVAELGAIERLQAGTDGLHPEPIDASDAARAAVERFQPGATAAGVSLAADARDGSGPSLAADRMALERILANLVGNAIASAGPGGHVSVGVRPVGEVGGAQRPGVAFSVTDDGPGFPPGGAERAFERFYRGDPARTGEGSGLGLAIVMELALAHGGEAHAENLSPRGARVSVVLPVVPTSG
jgi:signal transduction histidine kinase